MSSSKHTKRTESPKKKSTEAKKTARRTSRGREEQIQEKPRKIQRQEESEDESEEEEERDTKHRKTKRNNLEEDDRLPRSRKRSTDRGRKRSRRSNDSEDEEESEEEMEIEHQVPCDKKAPPKMISTDIVSMDKDGKTPLIDAETGELIVKTVKPTLASEKDRTTKMKVFKKLLKTYKGKIPVVIIEKGNKVCHPLDFAYVYDVTNGEKGIKLLFHSNDKDDIEKPGDVLTDVTNVQGVCLTLCS